MADLSTPSSADVDAFIERWSGSGASERSNYQLFLSELCDLLGVDRPDPAGPDTTTHDYVFERRVDYRAGQEGERGFIDLYKQGCFVLEAKQGRDEPQPSEAETLGVHEPARSYGHADRGRRAWERAKTRAKNQAFRYALRQVWTDPLALDPTRRATAVTRDLATNLAKVAASLERGGHDADRVAGFLMRCLFTMFAEDVGLLPERSFTGLLADYRGNLDAFPKALEHLWTTMDEGGFEPGLKADVQQFNGSLFHEPDTLPVVRVVT